MKNYYQQILNANPNLSKTTKLIYLTLFVLLALFVAFKLIQSPKYFLIILALYTAIVFHELGHGYMALLLGDDTAKRAKRLTFNPIKHIDPLGLLLPIMLIVANSPFVLGWAKPVPINLWRIKNQKKALLLIGSAGVIVNIFNCIIASLFLRFFTLTQVNYGLNTIFSSQTLSYTNFSEIIIVFLLYMLITNLALAIFNLIPIPPLDGSRIVSSFLSFSQRALYLKYEQFGFLIVIILLWAGALNRIIMPIFLALFKLFLHVFSGFLL